MDYKVLIIVILFLFIIFIFKKINKSNALDDDNEFQYGQPDQLSTPVDTLNNTNVFPYEQIGHLFTPAERSFYGVLCQATSNKAIVFGKVRVADILKTQRGLTAKTRQIAFNRISRKHFDFVLCNPDDLSIIATVELDDASHNNEKTIKRDAFLESACEKANLKLYRFKAKESYSIREVQDTIFPVADTALLKEPTTPNNSNNNQDVLKKDFISEKTMNQQICPNCSSELVTRVAKKGGNKGNTFLACSAYPKCKFTVY